MSEWHDSGLGPKISTWTHYHMHDFLKVSQDIPFLLNAFLRNKELQIKSATKLIYLSYNWRFTFLSQPLLATPISTIPLLNPIRKAL